MNICAKKSEMSGSVLQTEAIILSRVLDTKIILENAFVILIIVMHQCLIYFSNYTFPQQFFF